MAVIFAMDNPVNRIDRQVAFGKPNAISRLAHIPVGAGLPAMRSSNPTLLSLTVRNRGQARLPQGFEVDSERKKPLNRQIQGLW
jgi:hypothetical protein